MGLSVSYVGELQVDSGEKMHVKVLVKPKCEAGLPFVVSTAKYELIAAGGETEAEGECVVNDHVLDAFVAPQKSGTYQLKFTYEIADETWVDNIKLKVG